MMEQKTDSCLPDFFVLGAAKSGTTTLYELLKQHPDVYLPWVKEPQFFCNDGLYSKGLDYYSQTFFAGSEKFEVRGDATPHYLYFEKVAQRIKHDLPNQDLRFIVILRNPVKRAYSLYWNMVSEGLEELGFEEALRHESRRLQNPELARDCSLLYSYVGSGLYARQLDAYFKYFDRDRFLILFQDDLSDSPASVMAEVCSFLNLTDFEFETAKRHNEAAVTRSKALHRFLRGDSVIKKLAGCILPYRLKYLMVTGLIKLNRKRVKYVPMDERTEQSLKTVFEPDVRRLERITGRDLSAWVR